MIMLRSYFKIAWRNLTKNKVYSSINIGGLAVGLSSFIIILLYVNYELSFDTWDKQLKNVYRISMKSEANMTGDMAPAPLGAFLKEKDPDIVASTRVQSNDNFEILVAAGEKKIYQKGLTLVDSSFLTVFPYKLSVGDSKTALLAPNSVIITKEISKKLFGNVDPMGRTIKVFNSQKFMITGIMKEPSTPSHLNTQLVLRDPWMDGGNFWENYSYTTYTRIHNKTSFTEFENKINKIYYDDRIKKDTTAYAEFIKTGHHPTLIADAVPDIHNFPRHGESHFGTTMTLLLLAALLLISGAINFSNLALAKSIKRAREVGIRKVLGSTKMQVIKQFLFEITLQCLIALLCAMVLIRLTLPLFNKAFGLTLSISDQGNIGQLIPELILALLSISLLSGFYPALFLSRFRTAKVLKGDFSRGKTGRLFSNSLLVIQFLVSAFFISSAIVIAMQVNYMKNMDIGFNPSQVIRMEATQKTREENFQQTRSTLLSIPGVEYVSKSTQVPGSAYIDTATKKFKYGNKEYWLCSVRIGADYFITLRIPLLRGRLFSDKFPEDHNNTAILNESAQKLLQAQNPVGSLIRFPYCDSIPYLVVGVVKDFNVQGFENFIRPTIYSISNAHCGYQSGGSLLVKIKTDHLQWTLAQINAAWKTVEPDFPLRYSFLDQDFQQVLSSHTRFENIIWVFTCISLLIAVMGLMALASYMSERRTKEIGIRKVLGAGTLHLTNLLTKDFIKWVFIALVISCPIGWYAMNRWLENFAYRIHMSWWVFGVTGILVIAIGLITVGSQAIKAAMANPVNSLRME
jgi:putative ABC transport system permease protein